MDEKVLRTQCVSAIEESTIRCATTVDEKMQPECNELLSPRMCNELQSPRMSNELQSPRMCNERTRNYSRR